MILERIEKDKMMVGITTLGDIVKGSHFPVIEYRTNQMNMSKNDMMAILREKNAQMSQEFIFAGLCEYNEMNGSGRLISLDGDTYYLTDEVLSYYLDSDGTLVVFTHTVWS